MSIYRFPSSNKTEPMQAPDAYTHHVANKDDNDAGQTSPRGRRLLPKDLSAVLDAEESSNDSQPLKIKLTLPPGFRKRPEETVSSASRPPKSVPATKRGRPRKTKSTIDGDDYEPPRGCKSARTTVTTTTTVHTSSAPSRQPHDHHNIQAHHPSPDHRGKPRFPVFVPASLLSSDDLSGSEDSKLTDEETDEDRYPEETLVIDHQLAHDRARTNRELLGNDDALVPTRAPRKYKRHTNSKRHTPTVNDDLDGSRSSGNEEDDEKTDEEDEDEDDEADGDADHPTPMQVDPLSDDEDEKLDAQLFFSNLLAETSGSEDEDAATDRDSVMGDIALGHEGSDTDTDVEVGQFEQPLMVKEGWDGELVFSTEILPPPGALDFAFEADVSQVEDASQTDSLANSLSTLPVMQPATVSDEDEELEEIVSEAGDTTDDEIMPPSLIPLPFTASIAPQATFTPHKTPMNLHSMSSSFPSPSPADVLAGHLPWDVVASPIHSIAATDEPPPRSRSLSIHSVGSGSRGPKLGYFNGSNFGNKRTIIGDTNNSKLPSPFSVLTPPAPTFRRKRRANSDLGSFFTKRSKNSQSLSSSYFSDDLIAPQQGQLVDLDDLLDASLLSDDVDKHAEADAPHDAGLSRWDRIPMGIYRQTRTNPATHETSLSFSFGIGGFPAPLPGPEFASPNHSHLSHGSIDSILWEDEIMSPAELRRHNHHTHNKKRHREHDLDEPFHLSPPRPGPSRGDRTPTQPRPTPSEVSSEFLSEAKSRKDRRKEKKREKASLQKQILSALDETLAEEYEGLNGEGSTA